mmetsp:Transcript_51583/g.96702  ORF Transcript_51583/g.96702 Transcript_51583/m.96702 type:complete len:82 (+) Transcript_51583:242-487(+)
MKTCGHTMRTQHLLKSSSHSRSDSDFPSQLQFGSSRSLAMLVSRTLTFSLFSADFPKGNGSGVMLDTAFHRALERVEAVLY